MRIGIVILPDQRWSDSRRRWRQAEEWGFDHAWTYDHLGWRDLVDGPWFDAVTTLTAAATVTSRIRLGTLVASPNFRHPAAFARQVTALDDVSGGRLLLGLGAGGIGFDSAVLGGETLPPRQRVDRFAEFAELLDLHPARGRHDLARGVVRRRGRAEQPGLRADAPGAVRGGRQRAPVDAAGGAVRPGLGDHRAPTSDDLERWWAGVAEAAARMDATLAAAGRDPAHPGPLPLARLGAGLLAAAAPSSSPTRSAGPPPSASPTWSPTGPGPAAGTPATRPSWWTSPPACCPSCDAPDRAPSPETSARPADASSRRPQVPRSPVVMPPSPPETNRNRMQTTSLSSVTGVPTRAQ